MLTPFNWRKAIHGTALSRAELRQDLLDKIVWSEIIRLVENPNLIQEELDRLAAAKDISPTKRREAVLQKELARTQKNIDRLMTAYQEDLLSFDELRDRVPGLRQRQRATQAELQSIIDQVADRAVYLRLAETLSAFLNKLDTAADTLDVQQRQRIARLLVKEVLVGDDTIIIRHSIPIPSSPTNSDNEASTSGTPRSPSQQSYLLRSWSDLTAAGQYLPALCRRTPNVGNRGQARGLWGFSCAAERTGRKAWLEGFGRGARGVFPGDDASDLQSAILTQPTGVCFTVGNRYPAWQKQLHVLTDSSDAERI